MRFLDIGCGTGSHTLWAAAHGAKLATGMEPALAGSRHQQVLAVLRQAASDLGFDNVDTTDTTLQEASLPNLYDIVLVRHAINHLAEDACCVLHESEAAREEYRRIFRKLRSLMSPGGVVVFTDVARRNLLGDLGLRHPLIPAIQWYKHQSPYLWAALLKDAGFVDVRVSWLSPGVYLQAGWPLRNRVMAYLTRSEFRIAARSSADHDHVYDRP